MNSPQRFPPNEAFQTFDAEREFAEGERPLVAQHPVPKSGEVFFGRVIGAVNDPQVLRPPAFDGGLHQTPIPLLDEFKQLDHHPLAARTP